MKTFWVIFLNLFTFSFVDSHRSLSEKDHDILREEARELMRVMQEKSVEIDPDRKVCL